MLCLAHSSRRLTDRAAAFTLRRNATAAGSRLPASRRHFSVTDLLGHTTECFSAIHASGIPWYITIPLIAVGVNTAFRLPLQYYTRRLVLKRTELRPLIQSWQSRHIRTSGGSRKGEDEAAWKTRISSLSAKSSARIFNTWGLQTWKMFTPLLGFIPFTLVSESLRRLCGAREGWIKLSESLSSASTTSATLETGAQQITGTREWLDMTMLDGGCLWFQDLTAADPYMALPVLCSALLATNVWRNFSKEQRRMILSLGSMQETTGVMGRVQLTIGRLALLMPLVPLISSHLPAAVFIYWASSFGLQIANVALLDKILPKRAAAPSKKIPSNRMSVRTFLRPTTNKTHV